MALAAARRASAVLRRWCVFSSRRVPVPPPPTHAFLATIPEFFVPLPLVVQQLHRQAVLSRCCQTLRTTADVEQLLLANNGCHPWLEWSADKQLVRRRRTRLQTYEQVSGTGREGPTGSASADGVTDVANACEGRSYMLTPAHPPSDRGGEPEFALLHAALALLVSVIPTFPVPLEAVEAVMEATWQCRNSDSLHSHAAALRCHFPTATALLAHPQLRFAVTFSVAGEPRTKVAVQLHSLFAHTQRGEADALYAGLCLPACEEIVATTWRDRSAAVSVMPAGAAGTCHPTAPVVEVAEVQAMLEHIGLTSHKARSSPSLDSLIPVAVWMHTDDVLHLGAWSDLENNRVFVHCRLQLPYTALHGHRMASHDDEPLASLADRLVLLFPEDDPQQAAFDTEATQTALARLRRQWQAASRPLCCTTLSALAEVTGVPPGRLWRHAQPLWQANRLALVLGLPLPRGIGDRGMSWSPTDRVARDARKAPDLLWAATATAVARALSQREAEWARELVPVDAVRLQLGKPPLLTSSLSSRLASTREARELHGLNHRCIQLILTLQRVCTLTGGGPQRVPLARYLDSLGSMTPHQKEQLLQRLVTLWGADAVPAHCAHGTVKREHGGEPCASPEVSVERPAEHVRTHSKDRPSQAPASTTAPPPSNVRTTDWPARAAWSEHVGTDFLDEALTPRDVPAVTTRASTTAATVTPWTAPSTELGARLPPSFIDGAQPPAADNDPPWRRERARHTRAKPAVLQQPVKRMWERHDDNTRAEVASSAAQTSDLALDILDSASSPAQRRLHTW